MSKTKVERKLCEYIDDLKEKLEAAEGEANELGDKLERLQEQAADGRNTWAQPRSWEAKDLPVPRLEMFWERDDPEGYNTRCLYVLVYRHFLAGCGDKDVITAVPMGLTRSSGGGNRGRDFLLGDWIDTPFRDGAHAKSDAHQLGLPLFIVTVDGDVDRIDGVGKDTVRVKVKRAGTAA